MPFTADMLAAIQTKFPKAYGVVTAGFEQALRGEITDEQLADGLAGAFSTALAWEAKPEAEAATMMPSRSAGGGMIAASERTPMPQGMVQGGVA